MKRTRRAGVLAVVAVAAFAAGLLGSVAKGSVPTVTVESQAWWLKTGIVIPTAVGKHIHVKAAFPVDGVPIDGSVTITGTVTLHNQVGATDKTNWVRIGTESGTLAQKSFVLGPCADCAAPFSLTFSLLGVPTGRHELRLSANIPSNAEGNRQFQSFGEEICVRSCSPTYRAAGPYNEARGWYTGHGYANAKLTTALTTVRSGGTIGVRLSPGSGGLTTHLAGVYVDPDFHHGSAGIVVRQSTAAFTGSVTLPILPTGHHKLVLLSSDGQDAGIFAVEFDVP